MGPSKLFGQTPRTSIGISIPPEMIMPAILPGVEVPPGCNQVRVDVQIFLQALATSSGIELDYLIIVFRNDEQVCSRSISLNKMNRNQQEWYPLSQSFSFIDVPSPGVYTYKLGILPVPANDFKVQSLVLLDSSLLATVTEQESRPLPKETVLVGNKEMGSMFLCSTTTKLDRLIPTGQTVGTGVWLPDGSAFYGVSNDGFSSVFRIDAATSQVTIILPQGNYGSCYTSKNGKFVYVADNKGIIQIDTQTQNSTHFKIQEHKEPNCFFLHPDGKQLFVGLGDEGIAIVNALNMKQEGVYPVKGVQELHSTDNGKLLAAVGAELSFIFPATGIIRKVGSLESPVAAVLSSRMNTLCVTEKNKQLHLIDCHTGACTTIPLPLDPLNFLCLDDNRGRLYAPMVDSDRVATLVVVDLSKRAVVLAEQIHPGYLSTLKIDKNGRLWAATLDRILLLDADTLETTEDIQTGLQPCSIFFRP
jgi:sugar lactone lactonase YvrE